MFRCLTCQTRRGFRVFQQRDYVRLAYDTYLPDAGRQPRMERPPLLVLHGLLGSKQNWRSLAKLMSQSLNTKVIAVDLRNHGQSPVTETMSFHEIGKDLDAWCLFALTKTHEDIWLTIPKGGKVAMHWALSKSAKIDHLVVVDIAPLPKQLSPNFQRYIDTMQRINGTMQCTSKREADEVFQAIEPDLAVRQFLLTNLKTVDKTSGRMAFTIGLEAIKLFLPELAGFPFHASRKTLQFKKPMTLIHGIRSEYVPSEQHGLIREQFPTCHFIPMDTGHWCHAEKPRDFLRIMQETLASP